MPYDRNHPAGNNILYTHNTYLYTYMYVGVYCRLQKEKAIFLFI